MKQRVAVRSAVAWNCAWSLWGLCKTSCSASMSGKTIGSPKPGGRKRLVALVHMWPGMADAGVQIAPHGTTDINLWSGRVRRCQRAIACHGPGFAGTV